MPMVYIEISCGVSSKTLVVFKSIYDMITGEIIENEESFVDAGRLFLQNIATTSSNTVFAAYLIYARFLIFLFRKHRNSAIDI